MNDYELIYLIQTENDSLAWNCLFKKYENLIWKYIISYKIPLSERDDYYSEGLLALNKAANTFNDNFNKTFTRYFELVLKHRYWRLIEKRPKYMLCEDLDILNTKSFLSQEADYISQDKEEILNKVIENLTAFQFSVFELYFLENKSISEVVKILNKTEKEIYNCIYRIKSKVKIYYNNL